MDAEALKGLAALVGAFAALMGGLYAIVTRPLLRALDRIDADIKEIKTELKEIRAELKTHGERITRIEERLPPPLVHR